MPACIVVGCTNHPDRDRKTGITFHRFPKNEALKQQWVKAIRRENYTPSKCSNVCSDHFREEDMDRTSLCCIRLREGVVPSVFDSIPSHKKKKKSPTKRKTLCVKLPAKFEAKKGEDKKPFPVGLFVNEAFLHTKAVKSSVPEAEREQEDYHSGDVRFQRSACGIKTKKCALGNSWSRYSNEDAVDLPNENNELDHKSIDDCNQIKCETELQVDSGSLVSGDAVNVELNVEKDEEHFFFAYNSKEIKVENDDCSDVESNALYQMESESDQKQVSSNDCHEMNLETGGDGNVLFNSTGQATNMDGNRLACQESRTEPQSSKQNMFKEHEVFPRTRIDQKLTELWANNGINILMFTSNQDRKFGSERDDELINQIRTEAGVETEKSSSCQNATILENANSVNQIARYRCTNSVPQAFKHNGQLRINAGHLTIEKSNFTTCTRHYTGKNPLVCAVCGKTCTKKSKLIIHMRSHTGEKPYQCTLCGKAFAVNGYLTTHMQSHKGEKRYQCTVCDEAFIQKSNLVTHMRHHTGEKPYICTFCGKAFGHNGVLTIHIRSHTGEKPYKCNVCDKSFRRNHDLIIHTRHHTGEKPYQCTLCSKEFSDRNLLTKHMRCHTGEILCTVCDKAFGDKHLLTIHMRCHTGEKPYKCIVCDKAFVLNSYLTRHMRSHTGEKPYQCAVCGKAFSENFLLSKHMRCHTGEKPYKCSVCDKTFTVKSSLTHHMSLHTGERPYKCTVCDKTFILNSYLTRHMRCHTGEKPYKCTVCDKTFTAKSSLTIHMSHHTGERPYKCTVCDKTFVLNVKLTNHMRCHTGEKPHQCTVCDKAFLAKSNLTRHMRYHTGEKPYKCIVCDKVFTQKDHLTKHTKCHTRDKPVLFVARH